MGVLPLVAERAAGRPPVVMDGGIRRGTDILKAIALGAAAVLVGQPVLHALAVGGAVGVAHMLTILQTEFEVAMALTGRASLAEIDRSVIFERPGA
ncbi:alpha-hydroxy-acid oxidizing protein [Arenibaculum pallidiluteum]|uniref:alpha-hydroxy-acid oxidizing protein n=1 Tax=Arenibaculum pallidiluteum TaxID=2812559 RepID=UPI002E2E0F31|nr:alpha-hydroxy-acid oxidizing protein [Arenibaculum pallidiluteum]